MLIKAFWKSIASFKDVFNKISFCLDEEKVHISHYIIGMIIFALLPFIFGILSFIFWTFLRIV